MHGEAKIVFLTLDISDCVSEHKLLRVVSVEIESNVVQAQFVSLFLKGTVNTIDFNKVFIIFKSLTVNNSYPNCLWKLSLQGIYYYQYSCTPL